MAIQQQKLTLDCHFFYALAGGLTLFERHVGVDMFADPLYQRVEEDVRACFQFFPYQNSMLQVDGALMIKKADSWRYPAAFIDYPREFEGIIGIFKKSAYLPLCRHRYTLLSARAGSKLMSIMALCRQKSPDIGFLKQET